MDTREVPTKCFLRKEWERKIKWHFDHFPQVIIDYICVYVCVCVCVCVCVHARARAFSCLVMPDSL